MLFTHFGLSGPLALSASAHTEKITKGKYKVVVDRKEAIKEAIKMATPKDIIVLAGKGHEDYQEIKGVKYPMDERVLIQEILEAR